MLEHNFNPILLSLGPLQIRWYGVFYLLGFFAVIWTMQYYVKKKQIKLTNDQIWDFGYYCLLGVLVGGRLYEVLVWNPSYYLANPLKILAIWEGGMAYHGGLIGIIVGGWYFAKKNNLSFLMLADMISAPLAFMLGFGRIANFLNSEIWGPATDVSWCFQIGDFCRHPYQLYGALKRWVVAGVLFILTYREHKEGFVFYNFLLLMGLGRIIVDFWRVDTLYWGLSIGQWSSVVMVAIGLYGLWTLRDR